MSDKMASKKLQLFGQHGSPDYLKVLVTLHTTQAEGATVELNYDEVSKLPFLAKEKRPVLEVEPRRCLFSANEICRYLLETSPRGRETLSSATDDDWIGWEHAVLKGEVKTSFLGGAPSQDLLDCLGRIEAFLDCTKACLSGNEWFGLADIVVWSSLFPVLALESPLAADLSEQYPKVTGWFVELRGVMSFSHALKQVTGGLGWEAVKAFTNGEEVKPLPPPPATDQSSPPEATLTLTEAEIAESFEVWCKGLEAAPKPRERFHPVLPVKGEKNILITSALPYVNNVPHLGNIIGCVLSADVYSRFCRLRNYNSLYICGTDEYGTATETKALQEGVTSQELCAKYNAIHKDVYDWFNIDFDYFGRTSTPQQTEISQDIFWKLHQRGFISEASVEQLFCESCRRFLADRFVEGVCPLCSYEDARGDQCDHCGRLINAIELKNPRCKTCSSQPHIKSSDHLFLDLSKLAQDVGEWSCKTMDEYFWSSNSRTITSTWLRDGLKPRSITRDLKWGTPVPLEGYTDKVFYVWFDAPIGYISITACYTEHWKKWWKNPDDVTLYQFMAKDNVPFHTVVFPATLIGADDGYTLLNVMSATEYLNYEDGKFSKSRGVGVFGNNAQESGIPADIFRFYLLYLRPESQDTAFSWHDLMMKNNTELLNNLGNFINRSLMFLKNCFDCIVPPMKLAREDKELVAMVTKELKDFNQSLEGMRFRDGLKYILNVSRHANGYLQTVQPWKLVKGTPEDKCRAGAAIGLSANISCLLSVMLQPYMPTVSAQIQEQLQAPACCNVLPDSFHPMLPSGHRIGSPAPLFTKIEPELAQKLKDMYGGQGSDQKTSSASKPSQPLKTKAPAEKKEKRKENKTEEEKPASLDPGKKAQLEDELSKQSERVRAIKSSSASKEEVGMEISKLLAIKKALGIDSASGKKKKEKK